jgi:multidrug efflux pump subunit AcrA (membrane-fusion protein)
MQPEKKPSVSPGKIKLVGMIAASVLGVVVVTGIISRSKSDADLKQWTDAQAIPSVTVALPGNKPLNATLELPGRLEAYSRAPIYARVSGYLKAGMRTSERR